jgi:hypothetical protein
MQLLHAADELTSGLRPAPNHGITVMNRTRCRMTRVNRLVHHQLHPPTVRQHCDSSIEGFSRNGEASGTMSETCLREQNNFPPTCEHIWCCTGPLSCYELLRGTSRCQGQSASITRPARLAAASMSCNHIATKCPLQPHSMILPARPRPVWVGARCGVPFRSRSGHPAPRDDWHTHSEC